MHRLFPFAFALVAAATLIQPGCVLDVDDELAAAESVSSDGEYPFDDAWQPSNTSALAADRLPDYGALAPLFGSPGGAPMVVSNNPEGVNRAGLILATDAMNPADPNTVTRRLTGGTLDSSCPSGSMREFAFYMHHFSNLGTARFYVFVEPARPGTPARINAYGAAVSQNDTGSLGPGLSPSYAVSYGAAVGQLPGHVGSGAGSKMIREFGVDIAGPTPLVNLVANQGGSVDARFVVRSLNGECVRVRVAAAPASTATSSSTYELSKRAYAWGNVNTGYPCWSGGQGWGRPHGIYRSSIWSGSLDVPLTGPGSVNGWRFLAAPGYREQGGACAPVSGEPLGTGNNQRTPALRYYSSNTSGATGGRDSDPNSTANYGVEYDLQLRLSNRSGQCLSAKLRVTNYPGGLRCNTTGNASRHWDSVFRVDLPGETRYSRVFTKCPSDVRGTIASVDVPANSDVPVNIKTFVPGLISAPGGILLDTCPCGQTCPLD